MEISPHEPFKKKLPARLGGTEIRCRVPMYLNVLLHNINSEPTHICRTQDDFFSYIYLVNHFHHMVRNTQQSGAPISVSPCR